MSNVSLKYSAADQSLDTSATLYDFILSTYEKFHTFLKKSENNPILKREIAMIHHLSKFNGLAMRITLAVSAIFLLTNPGMAFDKVNTTFFGVAIKGYDTVAYHTESRAVKGKSKFSHKWNDAKWYFTNAENEVLFAADPERYAPQYGGY
ncbi:hypothetical protein D1AOALGA4SA_2785 [Olavius algarvensis Delta 1 endosymbiont]|nr:hypothetical protein D1AOALGA4SA_2785 [Olavius algarvensis Delta 1 endosymbiont]